MQNRAANKQMVGVTMLGGIGCVCIAFTCMVISASDRLRDNQAHPVGLSHPVRTDLRGSDHHRDHPEFSSLPQRGGATDGLGLGYRVYRCRRHSDPTWIALMMYG